MQIAALRTHRNNIASPQLTTTVHRNVTGTTNKKAGVDGAQVVLSCSETIPKPETSGINNKPALDGMTDTAFIAGGAAFHRPVSVRKSPAYVIFSGINL